MHLTSTRSRKRLCSIVFSILALLLLISSPLLASTTTINGVANYFNRYGAIVGTPNTLVGIDTFGTPVSGAFSFQLPPLQHPQRVVSATLSFNAYRSSYGPPITFNADLYALPARTSAAPLASDYFAGTFSTDPAAFPLQDNVLTPSSTGDTSTTVTVSPVDLAWYINGQYDRGLQPSSTYLFLRFSPDFTSKPFDGLNLYGVNSATLTLITAVPFPEPATAILTLTAPAFILLRRRPRPGLRPDNPYSRTVRPC